MHDHLQRKRLERAKSGLKDVIAVQNHQDDEVEVEEDAASEELSEEGVVYDVTTSGADFDVEGLVKRFKRGDIYRPDFQRQFVWSLKQASRFIESVLLGLPIPSVFLYRDEESQKNLIVDGLQRLTTLHAFAQGKLPNSKRVFSLTHTKGRFEGQSIHDLNEADKLRFNDAIIHAMIIKQNSPRGDDSAIYHIFDRLNSNGTPAQPQEIRAAIYHGPFQDMLTSLNDDENWRRIFGPVHKRGKDQELILRYFALQENWENYEKPMTDFLNSYMSRNRKLETAQLAEKARQFRADCSFIVSSLGEKPFRPKNALNAAVFDAFTVGLSLANGRDEVFYSQTYQRALQSEEFLHYVTRATSDEGSVRGRIGYVKNALSA